MYTVNQQMNSNEAVTVNVELEAAWLWFADQAKSDEARHYCYQQALRANPNSAAARQALAVLAFTAETPRQSFSLRLGRWFGRRMTAEAV